MAGKPNNSAVSNKTAINHEVDRDTYERFKQTLANAEGNLYGNVPKAMEDAMELYIQFHHEDVEDPFANPAVDQLDERLSAIEATLSQIHRERENDSSSASDGSYNARTERKVDAIVDALPEGTDVSDDIVEHVIEENAGTARKTVKKYKKLLRNRGIAFPDPVEQASVDDLDPDAWVVGRSKFAMRLEAMDDFSPDAVDGITAFYSDYLGDDWYLDALPNDWLDSNESKLERVNDDLASYVDDYRRIHGLVDEDGRKGFQ